MKTMYKCDKCGKVFEDYEECYAHEGMHWTLERWSNLDVTLDGLTEYKEGQDEPNVIHMSFRRWNPDKCEYETRCGKFKLVSSYDAPLVITEE